MEVVVRLKVGETELVTLEEALASTRRQMVERFSKHVSPVEARVFKLLNVDKRYVKAEGIRVFDEQGDEYLDFTAGYGALSLGHNPTEVLRAVQEAAILPTILSYHVSMHRPVKPADGALVFHKHNSR